MPATRSPAGYLRADIHEFTAARVRAIGGLGEWRKPIHGTSVLVAADGRTVLGHIRTLGMQLPAKDRRYSLKIKGVTFVRILPLLSATQPIRSELAPYDSMKDAQAAGTALIKRMVEEN
jgi:hypothetical protein